MIVERRRRMRRARRAGQGGAEIRVGLCLTMSLLIAAGGCARFDEPRAAPGAVDSGPPAAAATVASHGKPPQVLGLTPDKLQALLGEPAVVRRDPPAEVWQYRGASCILDLFVYEEPEGQRVLYAEARTGGAEPTTTEACIGSLMATHAQGQAS